MEALIRAAEARPPARRRLISGPWVRLLSLLLSAVLLAVVAIQFASLDWRRTLALLPSSPPFWLAFAAFYLIGPAADWAIFRRLWRLPPAAGFVALVRKMIYNELVLGYLGETWFYTWARRHGRMTRDPFGAIKDVAIVSALAGNLVTLALMAALWPLVRESVIGAGTRTLVLSLAPVVLISLGVMLFRRKVFSLPRGELAAIAAIHLARILGKNGLLALVWHIALPAVPIAWWLYLATLRLLITRLPMVPNKDVIFAALVVLLLGSDREVVALMATTAALVLAAHLVLGAVLLLGDIAGRYRR